MTLPHPRPEPPDPEPHPYVFLNGSIIPLRDARVSPMDRAFLYGDALFETLGTHNGKPYRLGDHLERLGRAGERIRLDARLEESTVAAALRELRRRNALDEMYIRITVSRGPHRGTLALEGREPTVFIHVKERPVPDARHCREGVRVKIVRYSDGIGHRPIPVKSTSYLTNLVALDDARRQGFYEVLFSSDDGRLAEGAVSNIFFAGDDKLVTPALDEGILPGVTRAVLLELARREGMSLEERSPAADEVSSFRCAFLTNALVGMLPVSHIGKVALPALENDIVKRLRRLYEQDIEDACPK